MGIPGHFSSDTAGRKPGLVMALVAGLIGIIVLISLGLRLTDKLNELRTAPRDNTQYTLFQTKSEYMALKTAWLVARGQAGPPAAELKKRFDIFYSRVNLLKTSSITQQLRKDPEIAEHLAKLDRFLSNAVRLIDAGLHKHSEGWTQLGDQVAAIQPDVNSVVQRSLEQFSKASDAERAEFEYLLLSLAGLVSLMGLMLATSLFSVQRKAHVLRKQGINLAESQEQLRATVASALDAVIIADKDGKIIDWNDEAAACFGYSRDVAIGRCMSELIVPAGMRAAHEAGMKRYLAGGEPRVIGNRIEINALNAAGNEFPIELAVGSADTSGGPIFVAFARDISDRKAKQEELHQAAQQARAGEKAKSAFLAVMSHEMRTPLNGILGTLELMCDTPLNPRQRKLVETANMSGELLLDLINNVLDLSKMEADKLELRSERFDLRQMLEQLNEMLAPSLLEAGNGLTITLDDRISRTIETDPSRLRQALINLLSNATKFTTKGAISVDAQLEPDDGSTNKGMLRFSISDTGIGIPRHRLGELFEDFAQIDPSFRRRQSGTGLGLAITRRTIEAMGGKVGVSSTEGQGSTFWFTIPVTLHDGPVASGTDAMGNGRFDGPKSPHLAGCILVAEDNFTNAMVVSDMLESEGHKVVHVKNGQEAVHAAREGTYNLVLMDISMPEMDGIEATLLIRENELKAGKPATPILALTANAMPEEVERFRKAGMDGCLTKPIRKQKLADAVQQSLAGNSAQMKNGNRNAMHRGNRHANYRQ
jgi:PAS domain S-box-containing protein